MAVKSAGGFPSTIQDAAYTPCAWSSLLLMSTASFFSDAAAASHHRGQIEILVGDVNRQHAVGLQVPEIQLESLARQQMYRNRIARKRIDHQRVEVRGDSRSSESRASPSTISVRACESRKNVNSSFAICTSSGLIS